LLPDSGANWIESNGHVSYRILINNDLEEETPVENTAAIFFDLNPPIITNTTLNTFATPPFVILGCIDSTACNYDPFADYDNGLCTAVPICNTDICSGDVEVLDSCFCIIDIVQVLGCMDSTALNYNSYANCDDGTCNFTDIPLSSAYDLEIYPNPSFGKINIETTMPFSRIEVYDKLGSLVVILKTDENQIDLSALPAGS